jgi:Tol biopolymer transport system component
VSLFPGTRDRLLFSVAGGQGFSLWTLSLPDRKTAPFADVHSPMPANATFSPDGRWIAYSTQSQVTDVFVQPFPPTGATYQVGNGIIHPAWSTDGKELFFTPRGRFVRSRVTTARGFALSEPDQVPRGSIVDPGPTNPRPYDLTPDGKVLGVVPLGRSDLGSTLQIQIVLNWFEELKQRVPTNK